MRERGFTVVEVLMVAFVMVIVATFAGGVLWRAVFAEKKLGTKIDLLHRAQMASLQIAKELRHGVEIFYPQPGLAQTRPLVVFANETNEIIALYVNEKGDLVRLNRHEGDRAETLARGVTRVRFYRKGRRLVNFHIHIKEALAGEQINLITGISLRNNFN
jgi:type II secretory pathway pseudopilin PulG